MAVKDLRGPFLL